jgi:hypothetical protein
MPIASLLYFPVFLPEKFRRRFHHLELQNKFFGGRAWRLGVSVEKKQFVPQLRGSLITFY